MAEPARLSQYGTNHFGAPDHEESPRVESLIRLNGSNIALRAMIFRGYVSDLRPLVILNSIEYPMPPSVEFCEQMWAIGLQVIFLERPGFGNSHSLPKALFTDELIGNGATAATESALIQKVLQQLELKQIVLLGMGSANPVCYRLSLLADSIALSIYSNVVFNKDILDVFRPKWLQQMFRQMVQSKSGLQIASLGIKFRLRRKPLEFYRTLMHQSDGDVSYLEANQADFIAAGQLFQSVEQSIINYDFLMSLKPDPVLKDGFFNGTNSVALSGIETPDHWRTQLDSEAARLGIPVAYAPHGDFFAPYASSDFLAALIQDKVSEKSAQQL